MHKPSPNVSSCYSSWWVGHPHTHAHDGRGHLALLHVFFCIVLGEVRVSGAKQNNTRVCARSPLCCEPFAGGEEIGDSQDNDETGRVLDSLFLCMFGKMCCCEEKKRI